MLAHGLSKVKTIESLTLGPSIKKIFLLNFINEKATYANKKCSYIQTFLGPFYY